MAMKVTMDRLYKLASTLLSFEVYPIKIRLNKNSSKFLWNCVSQVYSLSDLPKTHCQVTKLQICFFSLAS